MKTCQFELLAGVFALSFLTSVVAQPKCPSLVRYGEPYYCGSDSTIPAKLIQADVVIDSLRDSYTLMIGHTRRKWVSIVNKRIVDTTVFSVDSTSYYPQKRPSLDTAGVVSCYVDSSYIPWEVSAGDTLKNVFLLQEKCQGDGYNLTIEDGLCYFLEKESSPSMGLNAALNILDDHMKRNSLYRGYTPPSLTRLGPIVKSAWGDPGWEIRAYSDSSSWYILYRTGYGDCPAGCIGRIPTIYRISMDGVSIVDTSCIGCISHAAERIDTRSHSHEITGKYSYDVTGRRVPIYRKNPRAKTQAIISYQRKQEKKR